MRTLVLLAVASLIPLSGALACDNSTGERIQHALVFYDHSLVDGWIVSEGEVHVVRYPNGAELGFQIATASPEKHIEQFQWRPYNVELVSLDVLDLTGKTAQSVLATWGGANSSNPLVSDTWSASGRPEVRDAMRGTWFTLLKPNCVSPETFATSPTERG